VPEIQLFTYEPTGDQIQAVMRDGTPWMVAAPIARALAYRDANDMTRTLDEDEKGTHTVRTPGGDQRVIVISEAGLYRVLAQRRAGAVRDAAMRERVESFQRWVFHTVIPAAVRGELQPAEPAAHRMPQTYVEALRELASTVERAELAERTATALEPSAAAWDHLASGDGDWSVADAAKILSRDPAIRTGQGRLFKTLGEWGWLFRGGDGAWRVKQPQVETGRLSEIPQSHYHPRTGDLVLDPPQVRVKPKGLAEIHRRLGGTAPLAVQQQLVLVKE
jgi:prophage antirepressor-like protein